MDEITAVLRARALVNKVAPGSLPVVLEPYASEVDAKIKIDKSLSDDEDGYSMQLPNGKFGICVNGNQKPERQRFTICHELAHIVLGLPSDHAGSPSWSYSKRHPNEILCDVFAAELLLPYKLFKPFVDDADYSLATISSLAGKFEASLLATGSRFAALSTIPCAFVLCEGDRIRYASRSGPLRDAKGWIDLKGPIPDGSGAAASRNAGAESAPDEVDADLWFADCMIDGSLIEDARYLAGYDQTVSLLWFEDLQNTRSELARTSRGVDVGGLSELDGILPWPGRSKRR
ncbi:MAG TPA: ImmA/IrrE family metallo-endopeptidase [Sphingomicrobium sp.]|jgi:hypothetical protein|nr:ImmA/IrrE family metallo-endopeptidase [Sphingomicrobium sp.]